ncbi:MAG: hypothetical protein IJ748_06460 [Bacteroidales bacterium]|nr:hypothetical protein [Bacteroidales bacterium]
MKKVLLSISMFAMVAVTMSSCSKTECACKEYEQGLGEVGSKTIDPEDYNRSDCQSVEDYINNNEDYEYYVNCSEK